MALVPVLLSHEYPPQEGGIGDHVGRLAGAFGSVRHDLTVHVIANSDPATSGFKKESGVNVHRISSWIAGNNFLHWALVMNTELVREINNLGRSSAIGVLHAHDWITVPAAVTMKIAHRIPFVLTLHSTESRRCNGIHTEYSRAIQSVEDEGLREASRIIVNDEAVRNAIMKEFGTLPDKIETVPPDSNNWAREISSIYESVSSKRRQ